LTATIINCFGGPGVGKSTLASQLFVELKKKGYLVEQCQEVAKELAWENDTRRLREQLLVFTAQYERLIRVHHLVRYVVTDSPLLLSIIYQPKDYPISFTNMVYDFFSRFNNFNLVITRTVEFQNVGRLHNLSQSRMKDLEIISLLDKYKEPYLTVSDVRDQTAIPFLLEAIVAQDKN
jgi:tRNA uridine 5-carbamoylmethylation protein Kti12